MSALPENLEPLKRSAEEVKQPRKLALSLLLPQAEPVEKYFGDEWRGDDGVLYYAGHKGVLYYFDEERADAWCYFAETFGSLTDGKSGQDVNELLEWHKSVLRQLFGWRRVDNNRRRYRKAFIFVPRKNAKTWLTSIIAMGMLVGLEGEKGQQIYIACAKEEQAKICYEMCAAQVDGWKEKYNANLAYEAEDAGRGNVVDLERYKYRKREKTLDYPLHDEFIVTAPGKEQKGGSILHVPLPGDVDQISWGVLRPLPGTAKGVTGLNASTIIFDEYHELTNRELETALTTSMVGRDDPLVIYATTAGNDIKSPCHTLWRYSCKVRDGILHNDGWLPVVYSPDDGDDPEEESTLAKVNPAWNKTVNIEIIREIFELARQTGDATEFERAKQFHANVWIAKSNPYIPLREWDACGRDYDDYLEFADFRILGGHRLAGRQCYAGMDIAKTRDLNALNLTFWEDFEIERPDGKLMYVREYDELTFFWCAEKPLLRRVDRGYNYDTWADMGLICVTPGRSADHDVMAEHILQIGEIFNIVDCGFDPYQAYDVNRKLENGGMQLTAVRQGHLTLNAPTVQVDLLVNKRRLHHNKNAVQRWCVSNAVAVHDKKGNIMLNKDKEFEEMLIDGAAAMITSHSRCMTEPDPGLEPDSAVWS